MPEVYLTQAQKQAANSAITKKIELGKLQQQDFATTQNINTLTDEITNWESDASPSGDYKSAAKVITSAARVVGEDLLQGVEDLFPSPTNFTDKGALVTGVANGIIAMLNLPAELYGIFGEKPYEVPKLPSYAESVTGNITEIAGQFALGFGGASAIAKGGGAGASKLAPNLAAKAGEKADDVLGAVGGSVGLTPELTKSILKAPLAEFIAFDGKEANILNMLGVDPSNTEIQQRLINAAIAGTFEIGFGVFLNKIISSAKKSAKSSEAVSSSKTPEGSEATPETTTPETTTPETTTPETTTPETTTPEATTPEGSDKASGEGVDGVDGGVDGEGVVSKLYKLYQAQKHAKQLDKRQAIKNKINNSPKSQNNMLRQIQQLSPELWSRNIRSETQFNGSNYYKLDNESVDVGYGRREVGGVGAGEVGLPVEQMHDFLSSSPAFNRYTAEGYIKTALSSPTHIIRTESGDMIYSVALTDIGESFNLRLKATSQGHEITQMEFVANAAKQGEKAEVVYDAKKNPSAPTLTDEPSRLQYMRFLSLKANKLDTLINDFTAQIQGQPNSVNNTHLNTLINHHNTLKEAIASISTLTTKGSARIQPNELTAIKEIVNDIVNDSKNIYKDIASGGKQTPIENVISDKTFEETGKVATKEISPEKLAKLHKADLPKDNPDRDLKNLYLTHRGEIGNRELGQRYGRGAPTNQLWWYNKLKGAIPANAKDAGEARAIWDNGTKAPGFFTKKRVTSAEADKFSESEKVFENIMENVDDAPAEVQAFLIGELQNNGVKTLGLQDMWNWAADEANMGGYPSMRLAKDKPRAEFEEFLVGEDDAISRGIYPDPKDYDNFEAYKQAYDLGTMFEKGVGEYKPTTPQDLEGVEYGKVSQVSADDFNPNNPDAVILELPTAEQLRININDFANEFSALTTKNQQHYKDLAKQEQAIFEDKYGIQIADLSVAQSLDEIKQVIYKGATRINWREHAFKDQGGVLDFVEQVGARINKAPVNFTALSHEARITYKGDSKLVKQALDEGGDGRGGEIIAAISMMRYLGDKIVHVSNQAINQQALSLDGSINAVQKTEFANLAQQIAWLQESLQPKISEAGRVLRAAQYASKQQNKTWQTIVEDMSGYTSGRTLNEKQLDDIIKNTATLTQGEDAAYQYINDSVKNIKSGQLTLTRALIENIVTSKLSGLSTIGINIVSNLAIKTPVMLAEIGMTGALADGMRAMGMNVEGGARTKDVAFFLQGVGANFTEAFRSANRAYKNNAASGRYGSRHTSANLQHAGDIVNSPMPEWYGQGAGKIVGAATKAIAKKSQLQSYVSTRPLAWQDEFTKSLLWRGHYQVSAQRHAMVASEQGIEDASEVYNKLMRDINPELAQEAGRFADIATATQDTYKMVESTINVTNRNYLAKSVFPFMRSIINDADWALQRTWLGVAHPQLYKDLTVGGTQQLEATSRLATIGMGIAATGYALEQERIIDESGADWRRDKLLEVATGEPQNAVKVFGEYWDMGRVDPLGWMLIINSALINTLEQFETSEEDRQQVFERMVVEYDKQATYIKQKDKYKDYPLFRMAFDIRDHALNKTFGSSFEALSEIITSDSPYRVANMLQRKIAGEVVPHGITSYGRIADVGGHNTPKEVFDVNDDRITQTAKHVLKKIYPGPLYDRYNEFGKVEKYQAGPGYAFGIRDAKEYNEWEKELAVYYANADSQLPKLSTTFEKSKHLHEAGGLNHVRLNNRQKSFYKSLRGLPIYEITTDKGEEYIDWTEWMIINLRQAQEKFGDGDGAYSNIKLAMRSANSKFTKRAKQILYETPEFVELREALGK